MPKYKDHWWNGPDLPVLYGGTKRAAYDAVYASSKGLPKPKPVVVRRVRPPPPPPHQILIPGLTLIETIIHYQHGKCLLCGTPLNMINPHNDMPYWAYHTHRPTFEHVVPKAKGGKNIGNRLVAHRLCNQQKDDRMPTGCELIWLAMVNAKLQIQID